MTTFSVIIPAYNSADFLPTCLDSVVAQTHEDWECIVVDDGSVDGSSDVIGDYALRDRRFRAVRQNNAGAAAARNAGIARSAGEWRAFLDADDYYYPQTLAAYAQAARESAGVRPRPQILCGVVEDDADPQYRHDCNGSIGIADAFFRTLGFSDEGAQIQLQGAAFSQVLVQRLGGFSTAYRTGEDREFLVRATAASTVATVRTPVAVYTTSHGQGKSEKYLASGEKIVLSRRMLLNLSDDAGVRARLRANGERARFNRLLDAQLSMLSCAQALRTGETASAAVHLREAARGCERPEELRRLSMRLCYFLYFGRRRPAAAAQRCRVWLRALTQQLRDAGPQTLLAELEFCERVNEQRAERQAASEGHS